MQARSATTFNDFTQVALIKSWVERDFGLRSGDIDKRVELLGVQKPLVSTFAVQELILALFNVLNARSDKLKIIRDLRFLLGLGSIYVAHFVESFWKYQVLCCSFCKHCCASLGKGTLSDALKELFQLIDLLRVWCLLQLWLLRFSLFYLWLSDSVIGQTDDASIKRLFDLHNLISCSDKVLCK